MVIVKLMGGIGNQMFQYAAGRRLADIRHTDLKIDLSWFGSTTSRISGRRYELDAFKIHEDFASRQEIATLRRSSVSGKIWQLFPFTQKHHIHEKHFHFDPDILALPDNVYLEGYWQSPRYFSDIEDKVRTEFIVKCNPDRINRDLIDWMTRTESVAVHVRRGDYVSDPRTSNYHGVCSVEYYQAAVKMILERANKPHFFIFSDDPDWARENLSIIRPTTVIDHNPPGKAYEDLRLLTHCRHFIIANSSFSWWGAWLSKNPGKQVIAPARWFENDKINTDDLIPETWMRI